MSKLGTAILFIAVLVLGIAGAFLGLHATSQPFAIHMALFTAGCAGFLFFILRRAKFD
jgi:hypothetical protein